MQRKGVVNSSWTISITRRPGNQDVWATWWVVSFSSVGAMSLSLGAGVGVRVRWLLGMNPSVACASWLRGDRLVPLRRHLCSWHPEPGVHVLCVLCTRAVHHHPWAVRSPTACPRSPGTDTVCHKTQGSCPGYRVVSGEWMLWAELYPTSHLRVEVLTLCTSEGGCIWDRSFTR